MVNSGARGTKDRNRRARTEVGCTGIVPITITYPNIFKYLMLVIYSIGTPGDVAASGLSLVLPRAAAGTRGKYSTLQCKRASIVRYGWVGPI
jgi:hypothetical protein